MSAYHPPNTKSCLSKKRTKRTNFYSKSFFNSMNEWEGSNINLMFDQTRMIKSWTKQTEKESKLLLLFTTTTTTTVCGGNRWFWFEGPYRRWCHNRTSVFFFWTEPNWIIVLGFMMCSDLSEFMKWNEKYAKKTFCAHPTSMQKKVDRAHTLLFT